MRPARPKIVLIALLVVTAATSAAVAAAEFPRQNQRKHLIQVAPSVGTVPAIPGDPQQVLATLVARLPLVAKAHIGAQQIPAENGGPGATQLALYYDLRVPSTRGADIAEAMWEGQILAGAVANEF